MNGTQVHIPLKDKPSVALGLIYAESIPLAGMFTFLEKELSL